MREKKSRRWLSLLLTAVMLLSLIPGAAIASAEDSQDDFYKIVHLDCGRKYFTKDWIKNFITEMAAAGYTHLELAFGNDGLRFLLDDMSVTANGTAYTSDAVKAGIQAGNKSYYDDPNGNALSQTEMDEIISFAKEKGIEIIPLLNTPGHMDAILSAATSLTGATCSYNGSTTTIDVTNTTAVAFTKALVQKYITYFAGKGCAVFNIGADEYANDVYTTGGMGFGQLQTRNQYGSFVTYVNDLATLVKNAGMTPMAFNDGIYYGSTTSYGTFDPDILISYWSSGWSGYSPASASYLANKGHKMINTHGDFYYVLGKNDNFDSGSSYAGNWDNKVFPGTTFDSEQAGAMFCIWCDYPAAETEAEIYSKVVTNGVLSAMSEAMGHMPETPAEDATVTDPATDVTVTAPGLTSLIVSETTAPTIEGASDVVAYDITPTTAGGAYTKSATVSIPVPADWTNVRGGVLASVNGEEKLGITGTLDGGKFTFEAPHFSTVVAYDVADTEGELTDKVASTGGTAASYVLDTDGLDADAQYLIVYQASGSATNGKALNTSKGSLDVTISDSKATPNGDASAALWTYSTKYSYYEYLSNGNNYLYPSRSGRYGNYNYSLNVSTSETEVSISNTGTSTYTIASTDFYSPGYVNYNNNAWTATEKSQDFYFYKYTAGTETWKVTPDLQASKISTLTVTNDGYTDDSWNTYETALTAANAKLTEVKNSTYNSDTAANAALTELINLVNALETAKNNLKKVVTITINYVDENGNVVYSENRSVAVGEEYSITLQASVTDSNGDYYVLADGQSSVLTGTATASATLSVNVKKSEKLPDNVLTGDLKVEFWITNRAVNVDGASSGTATNKSGTTYTYYYKTIDASAASTTEGVAVNPAYAPDVAIDTNLVYKKAVRLDADHKQDDSNGNNQYYATDEVTHVRFYNGAWQYQTKTGVWTYFQSGDQLVAYYLQKIEVTQAVDSFTVDWGPMLADGKPWPSWNWGNTWALSFGVVYDTGLEPAEANLINTTAFFNNDAGRNTGYLEFSNTDNYEIYKITATYGTRTGDTSTATVSYNLSSNTTETVVWETGDSDIPHVDGSEHACCVWNTSNSAILIRIYVREVQKETTLKIVYRLTDGTEFYDLSINAAEGTDFTGYVDADGKLLQTAIVNSVGNTQNITTDLKDTENLPNMPDKYKSGNYTYVNAAVSSDNQTLYLNYVGTGVKTFVYDFGLPMKISASALVDNADAVVSVSASDVENCTTTITGTDLYVTPPDARGTTCTLTVTLQYSGTSESYDLFIVPASNVLYEDGFMTAGTSWTGGGSKGNETTNATQSSANAAPYGYDAAYVFETGASGTQYVATVKSDVNNRYTGDLTFTFTGTGFDLIGACGPETGTLTVRVVDSAGKYYKGYLVDTSFSDSSVGDANGKIYQVPLIHAQGWAEDTYTVTIRGAYVDYSASGTSLTAYSLDKEASVASAAIDPVNVIYDLFDSMGFTDEEIDSVEFINMDKLYGVATYTVEDGDAPTTSTSPESMTLEIDGFRVYRPTTSEAYKAAGEQGLEYVNVLDAVTDGFAGYIEPNDTEETKFTRADYESSGGPQNEIYLSANTAVTFQSDLEKNTVVQISARAVSGTAYLNDNNHEIFSNTEMYYEVTVGEDGVITITNAEGATGMLALGNLKVPAGTEFTQPTQETYTIAFAMLRSYAAAPEEPEVPVFTPETFSVKVKSTNVIRNKLITVTITASTDVAKLTVNGKEVWPTNSLMVKWGWSKTYTYVIVDTVKKTDSKTYEIVAYDADGVASEVYTAQG